METRLFLTLEIPDDSFYATVRVAIGQWEYGKQLAVAGLYTGPIVADMPAEGENVLPWAITNLAAAYDAAHPALVKAFADDVVVITEPVAERQET